MKTLISILITLMLLTAGYTSAFAVTREMTVEFPSDGRDGLVKVISGEGKVSITGYKGSKLVVTATSEDDEALETNEKAKGMKRISGTRFNVSTDADNNAIIISRPMNDDVDLEIKVPFNTKVNIGGPVNRDMSGAPNAIQEIVMQSLEMALRHAGSGLFNGDVVINGISGEIEINTLNGDITLTDVTGSALANSLDGDITVVFSKMPEEKPMSFSTIDGDVDVTFPKNIKATVTASTVDGDVYTDFDMNLTTEVKNSDESSNNTGVTVEQKVRIDRAEARRKTNRNDGSNTAVSIVPKVMPVPLFGMASHSVTGTINGGGTVIFMKTVDGDIFIRRAK